MEALIQKETKITGSKNFKEISEITWYILGIPIFHSNIIISR